MSDGLTSVFITSIYFTMVAALSMLIENSCLVTDGTRPAAHSSIFLSNNADFAVEVGVEVVAED